MSSESKFIKVVGLSKHFVLDHSIMNMFRLYFGQKNIDATEVLSNISFHLNEGDTLGIIGSNGAGKSTLLKLLTNNMSPTNGSIEVSGSIGSILELGSTFQLDLNALQNLNIFRTSAGAAGSNISTNEKILEFAELENYANRPLREFSTGMLARLAFAAASSIDPDILIIDEALSVGDIRFQQKSSERIDEFKQCGKIIVFVSHDMHQVRRFCDQVLWLEGGEARFLGDVKEGTEAYLNSIWQEDAEVSSIETIKARKKNQGDKRARELSSGNQITNLIADTSIRDAPTLESDIVKSGSDFLSDDPLFPLRITRLEVNGIERAGGQVVQADFYSFLHVSIDCLALDDLHETSMSFYLKDKLGSLVAGGGTHAWGLERNFAIKKGLVLNFSWKLDMQPGVYTLDWFLEYPSPKRKSKIVRYKELLQVEILAPEFDVWATHYKPQFQR